LFYLGHRSIEAGDNKHFLCTGISRTSNGSRHKRLPAALRKQRSVSGFLTVRANTAETACRLVDFFTEMAKWRVAMRGGMMDGS